MSWPPELHNPAWAAALPFLPPPHLGGVDLKPAVRLWLRSIVSGVGCHPVVFAFLFCFLALELDSRPEEESAVVLEMENGAKQARRAKCQPERPLRAIAQI